MQSSQPSTVQKGPSADLQTAPGIRYSSSRGGRVISSGTPTLDSLLSSYGGIPLGSMVLVEEQGTTDFASVIMRCAASQGVVFDQPVWVGGVDRPWNFDCPGISTSSAKRTATSSDSELRIAWRYGDFNKSGSRARDSSASHGDTTAGFSHHFDITTRLGPQANNISISPLIDSLDQCQKDIISFIESKPTHVPARILLPRFLSPLSMPRTPTQSELMRFLLWMRALLQSHANVIAIIAMSTSLYPRSLPIVRSIEYCFDFVLELVPFLTKTDPAQDLDQNPRTCQAASN